MRWTVYGLLTPAMTMGCVCAPRAAGVTLHVLAATLAFTLAACGSPTGPGVSVVAAKPMSPSSGSSFSYYSQPVTLVVTPGVATGGVTPTSTVEIATDAAFTTVVSTQTVSPSASGQVTLVLDHLNPATTYYWRARTTAGNNPGTVSPAASFSIGPLLVIQAPVPVQPLTDTLQHKRPVFIVTNATRTGPSSTVVYRFEVATDSGFSSVVASGSVAEGPNQASFVPASDLVSGVSYYWRARAADFATGVTSNYSPPQRFITVNPDDGVSRYDLTLHLVSGGLCYVNGNLRYPQGSFGPEPDLTFDNGLMVSGDRLSMGPLPVRFSPYASGLRLELQRSGTQLTGTLQGALDWYAGFRPYYHRLSVTVTSGTADSLMGRLTATAHGLFGEDSIPNWTDCPNVDVAFTLTPHP